MEILLESTLRSTLIAACFALVLASVRIGSAAARHRWWTALVLIMLALPIVTAWGPRWRLEIVPRPTAIMPPISEVLLPAIASTDIGLPLSMPLSAPVSGWSWASTALVVYALGLVVFGGRLVVGTWRARALANHATLVQGRLTSEALSTPVTTGFVSPRVILPAGWPTWPSERLRAILAHESEHVRRHDTLVQWLALLNRSVFWFHPLAWWLQTSVKELAEEACDAAVIARGNDPVTYSEALLQCAESAAIAGGRVNAIGMTMPGSALPRRIRRILSTVQPPPVSTPRLVCAVILTASSAATVIIAAPGVTPTRSPLARPLLQAPTPAVAGGSPAFDVVSIKRNPERGTNYPLSPPVGGRLALRNQSVRSLISSSYRVQDYLIIGGPAWLRTDGFDIDAVVEATPPPPPPQMLLMIRTLLADRFRLVMHNERREFPIYKLVMARDDHRLGPNIRPADCVLHPLGGGPPPEGRQVFCGTNVGVGSMLVRGGTMALLAQQLGRYAGAGRPVVDATNLVGEFEWELKWTPESPDGNVPVDALPIFTALQEQLGVKLEPSRGPVDVLVIDSVAPPSEN